MTARGSASARAPSSTSRFGPRNWTRWRLGSSPATPTRSRSTWVPGWTPGCCASPPPYTVDWYDVDFPEVITARRQLIPDRANAHGVGTDLTDPNWLDAIPTARPAVIVADGLLAFLTQEDMISLLKRLTSHFPSGEVAFNGYSRFAIWAAKHYHGTQSVADLIKSAGFDDPREPERWNPSLRLVEEILLTREPEVAEFPPALRLFTRLSAHSTAWSRRGTTVLHYRF